MSTLIDVERKPSQGCGKDGRRAIYLRPDCECFNRSRKVSFWTDEEAEQKIQKLVAKWYSPEINRYIIEGKVIASNSEENALKEWWRVCEPVFIGVSVPVTMSGKNEVNL